MTILNILNRRFCAIEVDVNRAGWSRRLHRPPFPTNRSDLAAFVFLLSILVAGCVEPTKPDELFQLSPESNQNRAMQTRMFETSDEKELLSASAAALQDLGFQIEESVREVGFLRAAKERSAREYGQYIQQVLLFVLSLGKWVGPVDLHQKVAATLIARPLNEDGSRREVRIMFYRVVWKGEGCSSGKASYSWVARQHQNWSCDPYIPPGEQKMEMIRDPEIYQQFFAKLSKAVFLEPHTI